MCSHIVDKVAAACDGWAFTIKSFFEKYYFKKMFLFVPDFCTSCTETAFHVLFVKAKNIFLIVWQTRTVYIYTGQTNFSCW